MPSDMKDTIELVNATASRLKEFLSGLNEQQWSAKSACEVFGVNVGVPPDSLNIMQAVNLGSSIFVFLGKEYFILFKKLENAWAMTTYKKLSIFLIVFV